MVSDTCPATCPATCTAVCTAAIVAVVQDGMIVVCAVDYVGAHMQLQSWHVRAGLPKRSNERVLGILSAWYATP